MNKIPPFNHQSKSEVEEVCIYKKHVKWPSQNLAISPENKYKIARKNSKQQYLNELTFRNLSFSKKRIYVYNHAA